MVGYSPLYVAAFALAFYAIKRIRARCNSRFPPGPRGLPLIGNLSDIPSSNAWTTFAEWSDTYKSDIIGLNVLGQPYLILNTAQAAFDILDKQSSIYSDRPVMMMGGELVGWSKTLVLSPYGERFKRIRKMLAKLMVSRAALEQYVPLEELESHRLLKRIYEEPKEFVSAIRRTAGAIILKMSHGYQVKEKDDPIVKKVDEAMEQFAASSQTGAFLVDTIPLLRYVPSWFPGATFQRTAKVWKQTLTEMTDIPHQFVKNQMASGTVVPNFTSTLLDAHPSAEDEETLKWAAASMYSGGADTTVAVLGVFFLAMTLHPEAQAEAQAEIDRVIGNDRLPTLANKNNLPYVDALVKEVFRWQCITPLAIPHRSTKEYIHDGYLIPEGTLVIPNIWKMLHDPNVYANPMEFKPERFLKPQSEANPSDVCFGFGRRKCPGKVLGETSVWLECAMSLAVFNITKRRDKITGNDITPEPVMTSGTICHPAPFLCDIRPRSDEARDLIMSVRFAD